MPTPRNISPGGTRGTVFSTVAAVRLKDSKCLLDAGRYAGAVYLGGYAIECLLKWVLTERKQCVYLPATLETHNWDTLVKEAGLSASLAAAPEIQAIFSELSDRWAQELRYLSKSTSANEAVMLCHNLVDVYNWIREQA
jgi:hypothetical protein